MTIRARGSQLGAVGSTVALFMAVGVGTSNASILDNCTSTGDCSAPIESTTPGTPKVETRVIPGTPSTPGTSGEQAARPQAQAPQAGPGTAPASAPAKPLTQAQKDQLASDAAIASSICWGVTVPSGGTCGGEEEPAAAAPAQPVQAAQPGRPGTPARTVRTVSVREVVEQAKAKIKLPKPTIGSAPCTGEGCKGTVGVPTWFWLDGSEWQTRTDSASAGGHTVRVTAKPSKVTWSLGDGQSVTCTGPGTTYTEDMGWATSPDCGLENGYKKAGSYNVTADITYDVTVSGALDESETVTRSSSEPITVREIQTVIN